MGSLSSGAEGSEDAGTEEDIVNLDLAVVQADVALAEMTLFTEGEAAQTAAEKAACTKQGARSARPNRVFASPLCMYLKHLVPLASV